MEIQVIVTVPEYVLDSRIVVTELKRLLQGKSKRDTIDLFKKTIEGWANRPQFYGKYTQRPGYLSMFVHPGGDNADQYRLVNLGSPPHSFGPRRAPLLRFPKYHVASTTPRVLSSRKYRKYGPMQERLWVDHPGFKPRAFDETIAEHYAPTFVDDVNSTIGIAVAKAAK